MLWGLPGGSDNKEPACNAGDPGSVPGSGRSAGEGNGYPLPFLLGEFHGQRSLEGYSPWGRKELDTTERLHFTSSLHFFYYSCLGNPMDRGAWRATVHGVAKSTTQLSDCTANSIVIFLLTGHRGRGY